MEGEVLTSFDVTTLFTSIPGNEVEEMVINRPNNDPIWQKRTQNTPTKFRGQLKMVIDTTCIKYNGKIYEQTYGMIMGPPLSSVLSNLCLHPA